MRLLGQIPVTRISGSGSGCGRLLLITGTPGSGKRVLGNVLVDEHSFVHVDLDNLHANRRFLGRGVDAFARELEANIEPGQPMVVTWTSGADEALPFVDVMRSHGFEWIWVDGDRGAAFSASFTRPGGVRLPRFVDPFEPDGTFRPLEKVAAEMLEPGDVLVPAPAPSHSRRPRLVPAFARRSHRATARAPRAVAPRARTGIAAGLAFAAVVLAAITGFLALGPAGDHPLGRVGLGVQPAQAIVPTLPRNGVLVSGRSLAGVELGYSRAEVRSVWGGHYTVCKTCRPTTWIYSYPSGDPVGAGVKFRNGHVIAVFTLGMTFGWHTSDGLRVGEVLDLNQVDGKWTSCNGYSATTEQSLSGKAVTSILTVGPTVYGFSLSRPSESVCH